MFERRGGSEAKCKVCAKVYKMKKGNTSTIWRHAEKNHSKEFKEMTTKHDYCKQGHQPTVFQALKKEGYFYPRNSLRKKDIDDMLIEMIVRDLQPLSIVTDEGFRKFCRTMNQRYSSQLWCMY